MAYSQFDKRAAKAAQGDAGPGRWKRLALAAVGLAALALLACRVLAGGVLRAAREQDGEGDDPIV